MIDPRTAEHEAAHLVVGCALGLKLRRATAVPNEREDGYAWFTKPKRCYAAFGIMYAAGIAWESRDGGDPHSARFDARLARSFLRTAADVRTATRVAGELLAARRGVLARVARELLDRDLTAKDVQSLVLDL